jgi:hypothetical protein
MNCVKNSDISVWYGCLDIMVAQLTSHRRKVPRRVAENDSRYVRACCAAKSRNFVHKCGKVTCEELFEKRNEAAPIDRTISSSLSVDNRTATSTVSIKLK